MLTRPQQILLKRAQHQAALSDPDYRDAIADVSGLPDCRSSKDPRLTDEHLDRLLSYLEAIFWRQVDANTLPATTDFRAVFKTRNYWSSRNSKRTNSRDRYTMQQLAEEILSLEDQLLAAGCSTKYIASIQSKVSHAGPWATRAALRRTLKARQAGTIPVPTS